jgi:2-O-methyltransferase
MQVNSFLRKVPGVVHVGANSGQERNTYRDFGLRVVWVEAIDEVFSELVKNISDHPKQKAFCALLTDQDDAEHQFHIASNEEASSSIYQLGCHVDIWPEVSYLSSRTLRSQRLDSLFRQEGIIPSDYPALVMDVQSAELLVLKGAGQMLRKFRYIKARPPILKATSIAPNWTICTNTWSLSASKRYLEMNLHRIQTAENTGTRCGSARQEAC